MKIYLKRSSALSKRGKRSIEKRKLKEVLGTQAAFPKSLELATRVISALGYKIRDGSSDQTEGTATPMTREVKERGASEGTPESTRGESTRLLKEAGFVHSFVGVSLCRLAQIYHKYAEQETSAAFRRANEQKIHRYIAWCADRGRGEFESMKSTSLASDFWRKLSAIMKPNSVRNHCAAMCDLIHALSATKAARREIPVAYRKNLQPVWRHWNLLKRKTEKKGRLLQRRKMLTQPFCDAPVYFTALFIHEKTMSGEVEQCLRDVKSHSACDSDVRLILCVIASVLALHGQRKVSALGLTFEEIEKASYYNGRHVVRIEANKTGDAFGPSVLALKRGQYDLMKRYAEGRHCKPHDAILADLRGRRCSSYFKPLEEFIAEKSGDKKAPKVTFNWFRKTLETNRKLGASSHDSSLVTSYLSHSKDVSKKHYEYKTDSIIFSEAQEVESVWFQVCLLSCYGKGTFTDLLPEHCLGKSQAGMRSFSPCSHSFSHSLILSFLSRPLPHSLGA